jgi:DNA-binding transcriptional MerR regulator
MADTSSHLSDRGRVAAKSATAYRTISEVSDELEIPQHVLRFWETRFSQVKPLKRGGGRRYYRPEDIKLLRKIQKLLYEEGYTIRGVQKLLREGRIAAPAGREEAVRRPDKGAAATTEAETLPEPVEEAPAAGVALPEPVRAELRSVLAELRAARAALKGD